MSENINYGAVLTDLEAKKGGVETAIKVLTNAKRLQEKCRWTYNGDEFSYHDTSCGNAHEFIEGNVQENKYVFCPYCGRQIKEVIPKTS